MSLPAQPQKTNEVDAAKSKAATESPAPKAVAHDQRSYLALMTLAVFTLSSGLARAYRGDGWTRFWVYVGANIIMIIPILGQIVGGLTMLVLLVLGIVDVFKFHKATTDATGTPLAMTPTDKKWGHALFIFLMVVLGLIALLLLAVIALAGMSFDQLRNLDPVAPQPYTEPSNF